MLSAVPDFHIKPLVFFPEHFEQVATWHHQECERQGLKSTLSLRRQRLQLHVQNRSLPQTLIALSANQVIGCVSLVNYSFRSAPSVTATSVNVPPSAKLLWLSNLFVTEALRERGVGSKLIEAAIVYAATLGSKELWLSAAPEFTEFYRNRNWVIQRATRLGGRPVNILRRVWD
jgi:N-acetylglutamate synthase-like GNAT family acetyltransferase